jgi:hypothetical protein
MTPEGLKWVCEILTQTHNLNTGSANHPPPYLEMLFASVDSNGVGEAEGIVLFTALPPLGWTQYSDLDNRFPRGASTSGAFWPQITGTL